MKRSLIKRSGKPIRKRSKHYRNIPAKVRAEVWERSGGRCEGCHREEAVAFHHRLKQSQGGPNTANNLMHLGLSCHDWTERNPTECFKNGLLLTEATARAEGIIAWSDKKKGNQ